jgi:beta-lactamase regulating signal transducer with metallopeptidase domain
MQSLFDYILKLSVSLAMVYGFYQLVLRRLTFYNWNRWYLLGYSAVAFLIPLMDITKTLNKNEWNKSVILQYIPVIEVNERTTAAAVTARTWTAFDWLFMLLLAGMLVLIIKFAIRYLSFLKVRRGAILLAEGEAKLFMVEKDIIPFSFGNNIFINNQLKDEAELKEIIRHEFVHVKQKHTHDIIWSELLCILNWYNPFVWLIRKAIRQNLEFIADNKVLEQGFDKKKYQYLLLKVTGNNHFSIANQFNFSSLKKRIAMMNKMKSARAQLIKFLFIVPLIAVMLLAFRNERNRSNNRDTPYASLQRDYTDTVPDELPPPPPPPGRPPMPPMPPADIKLPSNVKSLTMEDDKLTVILKDGSKEVYDFTSEKEKKAFYQKYGRYFVPPPPPPPPGHGISIAPGRVIDETNVQQLSPGVDVTVAAGADRIAPITVLGHAKTITSIAAPVTTEVNVHGVTAATAASPVLTEVNVHGLAATTLTGPAKVIVPIKEVVVTGHSLTGAVATVPVAVNIPAVASVDGLTEVVVAGHPITRAGIDGEKVLELKIYRSTTRERIDQLIAEADVKGVELKFDKIEYDGNGKITRLAGKMEKGGSKSTFSLSDFEVLTLVVTKNNGQYNCLILANNNKEVQ